MAVSDPIVRNERANAAIGWALTGVVFAVAIERLLAGSLLWSGAALAVAVTLSLPAVLTRDATTIVPWPLVLVAAVALVARSVYYAPEVSGYVVIAAFAVVGVVELDAFTAVDMTRRFAVAFAVLATMATEGLWTIAQFYSDRLLGTAFLQSQRELQWDLVAVTAVALVMGLCFEWYLERIDYDGSGEHLPGEAESA